MVRSSPFLMAIVFALGRLPAQQPAAAPAQGATIRTTASEVVLDLSVRDKRGKLVRNLKQSEVTVLEDGKPQQLTSFRAVSATRETKETKSQKAGSDTTKLVRTPGVRRLNAPNLIGIVFHNLDPLSRLRAVEAIQEFLKSDIQPDTYIGVFLLDDLLRPVCPFTNDRNTLAQAMQDPFTGRTMDFGRASIAALTANPNQVTVDALINMAGPATTATVNVVRRGGEVSKAAVAGADVSTGMGANALRGDQVREQGDFHNISGMRETDKIVNLIQQFGTLPGRKTILLTSTGLYTTGDPDRFDAMLSRAAKAGITIYSLDVSDTTQATQAQAGNIALGQVASVSQTQTQAPRAGVGEAGIARTRARQGDELERGVRSSDMQAPLRALAEATGGFLIANTREYKRPFQRLFEDLETRYEVTYRPASSKLDGKLHQIEVKLARNDLTADSRTGYFAMPEPKGGPGLQTVNAMGLALLNAMPAPKAFEFRTSSYSFRGDGVNTQGAVAFEVPGGSLSTTPDPARQLQKLHFSLFALIKDSSGEVVDTYSLDAPFEIADANMAAVRLSAVAYTHPVILPSGRYTLEAAVLDHESGKSSVSNSSFEMAPARNGVNMSSAVLVQRVEDAPNASSETDPMIYQGKRVVPLVGRSLTAEMKPYVYFVVYPDESKAERPTITVEFLVDGNPLAKQEAKLPTPDGAGTIPMMVSAAMRPGNCELRLTVKQGVDSVTRSVAYSVAGK